MHLLLPKYVQNIGCVQTGHCTPTFLWPRFYGDLVIGENKASSPPYRNTKVKRHRFSFASWAFWKLPPPDQLRNVIGIKESAPPWEPTSICKLPQLVWVVIHCDLGNQASYAPALFSQWHSGRIHALQQQGLVCRVPQPILKTAGN